MGLNNRKRRPDDTLPDQAIELLGPYFPGLDLREVRIREGVPWYVPMKAVAYTDRNVIYFKPGAFDPFSAVGLANLAHELTHTAQYIEHGKWRFRALYLGSWFQNLLKHRSFQLAYLDNRFEEDARRVAEIVLRNLYE
jgi:hypothetical protein